MDFRKGPDSLAALVGAEYGGDLFSGVIYVFRAERSDRIKLIWWDCTGLCLMAKKLEHGGFRWPGIQDGVMRGSPAEERRAAREERSRVIVDDLKPYLEARLRQVSAKSKLAEAIRYALGRWNGLTQFLGLFLSGGLDSSLITALVT